MLFKNIALLSLAAFAVANKAVPVADNAPVVTGDSENPEDIHKLKDHIHSKKCPKPTCVKSSTTITTNTHTNWVTETKTVQKKCAPTQAKQPKKNCGKNGC
ncbi:hypothetical protein CJU90_1052 [Yarrowia sp. C11]|nr:hypothetical protein CKK34_2465 [Yarrowia sp. E02]KAG5373358.1 hypothetical protein CJU90_1052 [Yarrowia sp. C11]